MDAAHGATALALSSLSCGIREYTLFQGIQRVLEKLRQNNPHLDDEALYDRLEFQANPSLGFPGSDIDRIEFFEEDGEMRARMRLNLVSLAGAGSPLPAFYSEQALGMAPPVIRPASFWIFSIIASSACCCRSGVNIDTTPAFNVALWITFPHSCSP